MAKKRIVAQPPVDENAVGRFEVEELDDENEVVDDVEVAETAHHEHGILVTTQEPAFYIRSGKETIKSGGKKQRLFSPQTHGKNWRALAEEFMASCQLQDGEVRPKYVSHEEF